MLEKQHFIFKKILEDFLGQLHALYPSYSFGMYKNILIFSDPFIPEIFEETKALTIKFKQEIEDCNEHFFMDLDSSEFSQDSLVIKEIGKIKDIYQDMSEDIKEKVWNYIHKLNNILNS